MAKIDEREYLLLSILYNIQPLKLEILTSWSLGARCGMEEVGSMPSNTEYSIFNDEVDVQKH